MLIPSFILVIAPVVSPVVWLVMSCVKGWTIFLRPPGCFITLETDRFYSLLYGSECV